MAELGLELGPARFQTALCGGLLEVRAMGEDPNHACGTSLPQTCSPHSPMSQSACHAHNEGECGKEGGEGGVDEGSHGVSWWVTPHHQAPTAVPMSSRGISCCVDPHSVCLWILWLWRHSVQLGLLSGRRPGADPAPAHFSPT